MEDNQKELVRSHELIKKIKEELFTQTKIIQINIKDLYRADSDVVVSKKSLIIKYNLNFETHSIVITKDKIYLNNNVYNRETLINILNLQQLIQKYSLNNLTLWYN